MLLLDPLSYAVRHPLGLRASSSTGFGSQSFLVEILRIVRVVISARSKQEKIPIQFVLSDSVASLPKKPSLSILSLMLRHMLLDLRKSIEYIILRRQKLYCDKNLKPSVGAYKGSAHFQIAHSSMSLENLPRFALLVLSDSSLMKCMSDLHHSCRKQAMR